MTDDGVLIERTNNKRVRALTSLHSQHGTVKVYHILNFAAQLEIAVKEGMSRDTSVRISEYHLIADETIVQDIP